MCTSSLYSISVILLLTVTNEKAALPEVSKPEPSSQKPELQSSPPPPPKVGKFSVI